jgi:acylphosphatase
LTIIRIHINISGRVQGVFYRSSARRRALELGLRGWVRNLSNGRVDALVEGEEEQVEIFINWCRKGPPLAVVTDLKSKQETPTGEFESFRIRY